MISTSLTIAEFSIARLALLANNIVKLLCLTTFSELKGPFNAGKALFLIASTTEGISLRACSTFLNRYVVILS